MSIEFKYRLTKDDYDHFNALRWRPVYEGNPWFTVRWRVWLVSYVPLIVLGVLLLILRVLDKVGVGAFWAAFAGYVWRDGITSIWKNYLYKEYQRKVIYTPDSLLLKETHAHFDDAGFETNIEGCSVRWDWQLVKRYESYPEMDVLWVDNETALLLPVRIFENDDTRQQLANFVKAHIQS